MGIDYHHAALLIREHSFNPLPETVYLIGRQTIRLTYDEVVGLCRECGVKPAQIDTKFDRSTRNALASDQSYMTDETFFKMLGVKNVYAIDHSAYEGADIVLNLNDKVPSEYLQSADFVFGGSVCDNVFDPARYLKNVSSLLKPGGRLVDQNIVTNHYHPYAMLPAKWYFDYFVINGFADCKVYIIECSSPLNFYGLEVGEDDKIIFNFQSTEISNAVGIFLISERGSGSTIETNPTQDQYRSADEWERYRSNLGAMRKSRRRYFSLSQPSKEELSLAPPITMAGYRYLGRLARDARWAGNT
jgi:SAM-dependent methyltransferase